MRWRSCVKISKKRFDNADEEQNSYFSLAYRIGVLSLPRFFLALSWREQKRKHGTGKITFLSLKTNAKRKLHRNTVKAPMLSYESVAFYRNDCTCRKYFSECL